jgi:hypothetical protein
MSRILVVEDDRDIADLVRSIVVAPAKFVRRGRFMLLLLFFALAATGLTTPFLVRTFEAASIPVRIAVSSFVVFPSGLLMGMGFAVGMKLAQTGVGTSRIPDAVAVGRERRVVLI